MKQIVMLYNHKTSLQCTTHSRLPDVKSIACTSLNSESALEGEGSPAGTTGVAGFTITGMISAPATYTGSCARASSGDIRTLLPSAPVRSRRGSELCLIVNASMCSTVSMPHLRPIVTSSVRTSVRSSLVSCTSDEIVQARMNLRKVPVLSPTRVH